MLSNPLIIGFGGQLGNALSGLLPDANAIGIDELDLTKVDLIPKIIDSYKPSIIFNAAAYTAVDKAEDEENVAFVINAEATAIMAAYCKLKNIPFIHYSTDYVFDGSGDKLWIESDEPNPLSAYGRTKLRGEEMALASGSDTLIFRTSWVYDAFGKNFVNTMLRLGKEREELSIVSDQIGRPTYAPHLAEASLQAVKNVSQAATVFPVGVYHLTSGGDFASWYDFSQAIFSEYDGELAVKNVVKNTTENYPTPAKRPLNSRLDCSKAKAVLGIEMPDWRIGLKECMKEIKS